MQLKSTKKCNRRISFLINYKMYGKYLTLKLQLDIIQLRKKERVINNDSGIRQSVKR